MYELLFRQVLFPVHESWIKRRDTCGYIKEYNQQQWWDLEKLQSLQLEKLKKLLFYAYEHVPFYTRSWNEISFTPNDFQELKDIENLPYLTKELIKENFNELISIPHKNNYLEKSTGGSTGTPLKFAYTQESYSRRNAVMWRGYTWANLPPGRKSMYLWGTHIGESSYLGRFKDDLYNRYYNRSILSCFNLEKSKIEKYVKIINKNKPKVIVSYVNPIYCLAEWIKDSGLKIYHPESIITGAEPLLDYQRKLIEEVFECDVFNTYGCREVMLIASECSDYKNMHINTDHLIVEAVNSHGVCVKDELGELVLTDLHNYGMPFIRYKNEDLVSINDETCSCGRGLPLMNKIEGRILDCIKTVNGKILPGEFFPHYLKDFRGIEKFQVIQNELTKLCVNIVVNDKFSDSDFTIISREICNALGKEMSVEFNHVSNISQSVSGKHRVTISNIKE